MHTQLIGPDELVRRGLYASLRSVYDAKHRGRLPFPYIQHGRKLLFDADAVQAYIERSTVKPVGAA